MSKPKKTTLWGRLKNAAKAFRGVEITPTIQERPIYEVAHLRAIPIVGRASYFTSTYTINRDAIMEDVKRGIAREIAKKILEGGYILFTEDAYTMALYGKVYVLAPEEEAKQ